MGLAYGIGYGAERRHVRRAGFSFANAEAAAYVAAMAVEPDAARKAVIDALIGGLKADGLWSSILLLGLHATHDQQAARINAKTPAHVAAVVGASGNGPDFLQDNGFQGNGTDSYLDWETTLGELGCTDESAFGLVWSLSDVASGGDFGSASANISIFGRTSGNQLVRPVWNGNLTVAQANSLGLYGWNRSASNVANSIRNGVFIGSTGSRQVSDSLTTDVHTCRTSSGVGTRRLAATIVGTSLSEADHLKLFNRLSAYMEAVLGTPAPL
jgi:hypothetical protein